MALFSVAEDTCNLCGLCAAACPAGLVANGDGTAFPKPTDGADAECFHCGHCVAACPTGAFAHQHATPAQCLPIDDRLRVTPAQIGQLMRSRRSIRNFTTQPVTRQTIGELLDIARYAPSGCNLQPVHWLVVYDTEQVRRISGLVVDGLRQMIAQDRASPLAEILGRLVKAWDAGFNAVSRGAPHLMIAHAPQANPLSASACTIALTYLELAVSAFSLGACWMGLVDMTANTWPPLRELLALPHGHLVFGTLAIGHPEFPYVRIPPRNEVHVTWK
jgi:nitroreductase/NAD-dependent dihydropyrimidine dehydrogenase PreA subunit